MSSRIILKSTETVVDRHGLYRIDGEAVLVVDLLSDGSRAYNVYTRLGDQVYRDESATSLDEALHIYRDVDKALAELQISLGNCTLESPTSDVIPKPYVPDYTKAEPEVRDLEGRLFPGHFRWYLMVSHGVLDGFPVAGYASLQRALDQAGELMDIAYEGDCYYVVEV